ncbi:TRAP transporter permease [Hoeflea poritis]|uniref:TRAP transporter fused permease subunit n=1 Tax=Hoeflea poritis TaxID=2993659 RepID=A0ABT4VS17_9HYPH|nr:TRAP transporter fused permease subunit [Hoeflea poritis]MDA4847389.1 TRAP transporter fused permease subunit [Hoeflea poritis]
MSSPRQTWRQYASGVLRPGPANGDGISGHDRPPGISIVLAFIGSLLAFGMAVQSIYTAYFGAFEPTLHRGVSLGICAVIAVFANIHLNRRPRFSGRLGTLAGLFDLVLVAIIIAGIASLLSYYEDINESIIDYTFTDQVLALGAMLALIILSQRFFGLPLSLFAVLCLVYVFFGQDLPSFLRHAGSGLSQVTEALWYSTQGIFGMPTGIVLQIIFIFIVFGAVLQHTGAGDAMMRLSLHVSRRSRAGPAHAAIVSSAVFGSMSGSVTANVVGTGTITIPMVRKRGFPAPFAGGLEAAASTGGQILPPVMGAAAFLMAELAGVSYLTVVTAALIPGLFFYFSLFVFAALEARRLDMKTRDGSEDQELTRADWVNAIMFIAPIVGIVVTLVMGYSPAFAGFWGTVLAIIFSFINPEIRRRPIRIVEALVKGGVSGAELMVGVAVIGIVFGLINLSGVGLQIAILLSGFAGDSLFVALVVAALACLVLGMGMPTLPAYLIIVLVMSPSFREFDVPVLAMHFFVFYFGVLSAVTPPVALAAFAAAPIAGAGPIETGLAAMKLSIVGFVVPFVAVYEPSILFVGGVDPLSLVLVCGRLALSVWLLTTALIGFEAGKLAPWQRVLRAGAGAAILFPAPEYQLAALGVSLALLLPAVVSLLKPFTEKSVR